MEISESPTHYEDLLKYIADNTNIDECIVKKFLNADEEYWWQRGKIYNIDTPLDEIEYISTTQNIDRNLVDNMVFYRSKFIISKDIIETEEYYNNNKFILPVLSEYIVDKTNVEKIIVDKIIFNSQYVAKAYIYDTKHELLAEIISDEIGINKDIAEKILSTLKDCKINLKGIF